MIIGLTGGIGSGKSTVAKMFADLGVPVFIADLEGRKLLEEDEAVIKAVKDLFGPSAYEDGKPNRPYIASVVFSDPEKLRQLNAVIHPAVAARFKEWLSRKHAPYVIYEAAILFEHGGHKNCDAVIMVTAPKEMRISRVVQRDRVKREEVLQRMDNQWPEEKKIPLADIVVENIDLDETLRIVEKIHQLYVKN
ncbi:dephospho-CoA kinase [Robertkochia marina]|uniref:Dephospho-CoA kinase n=1 Tax=Robertkochia marina TaxID=1227945 RepID=A0A4S3M0X5_9FLAO|nr:dephospho-CoA kinase [Robertkochia marina]THD68044.1 dephospho-CoA kinase [Robertkochia marina]TRZ42672.1 dephospho-CoA kinase [Robertkochia marina]